MRRLILLTALLALAACDTGPAAVTLADLAADAERFDGDEVVTSGLVRVFDVEDGALERHAVIEDRAANRVELLPLDDVEAFAGQTVEVLGRFVFDPQRGRAIEVEAVDVLDESPVSDLRRMRSEAATA